MMINKTASFLFIILKATLGLMLFVLVLAKLVVPIASNDIWWHMALGRMHISTGSLTVDHSIYTWSPATAYHAYNSWISDIAFYLAYERAGVMALLLIKFSVFIIFVSLIVHFAIKRCVANKLIAWLIIMIGLGLCFPTTLIKPELFSILIMTFVVWLYYYLRSKGDRAWRQVYIFPIVIALWANVHGAFFLSAPFFAATIAGEFLNVKYNPDQAMAMRLRKHYLIALLLCIPAVLINPYGIELPLMIVQLVFNEGAKYYSQISAFLPTYHFNEPPHFLLDYLILSMVIFVVLLWQKMKLRKTDWVVIISFVIYCLLFIQMARTTFYLAPVFVFAALDMLGTREKSIFWSDKRLINSVILSGTALVMVVLIARMSINLTGIIHDPAQSFNDIQIVAHNYPQVEVDYIETNLSGEKIGNIYRDGGYLIFRLWPEKKVLIDPRYFPFKAWIESYFKFKRADSEKDIKNFMDSMKADFWLINYDEISLFDWFRKSNEWGLAYFGPVGAVFVPMDEFNGTTLFSSEIGNVRSARQLVKILNAVLVLNEPDMAKALRQIANANIGSYFSYKKDLIGEVDLVITALDSLNNLEFEKAGEILSRVEIIKYGKILSAKIYRYLASKAWDKKDYFQARKWSIAAHEVILNKNIHDIYSIVLTDWHARSDLGNTELLNDGVEWDEFADLLLKNSELIGDKTMLSVIESIKNETYAGDAELYKKSVSLVTELDINAESIINQSK